MWDIVEENTRTIMQAGAKRDDNENPGRPAGVSLLRIARCTQQNLQGGKSRL